jgi:osmotically-inducible protein OsmY
MDAAAAAKKDGKTQEMTMTKTFAKHASLTAAALLSVAGLAGAQQLTADQMEERIEQRWAADARLKACRTCNLDVEFDAGVAKLTGDVPTEDLKARAERLAKIDGVTRVENLLAIEPDTGATAADKTRDGVNKAADETADAVSKAADKTGKVLSKSGEVITDAWITTKVKGAFMGDDPLEGSSIDVDTKDNVVTLKGTVPNEAARAYAVKEAKQIEGVKRVVDQLRIAPKTN